MALGGWLPAAFPRRLVCPGWFLPGRVGTRIAIWRQIFAERVAVLQHARKTKLIGLDKARQEEHPPVLRGVNSMVSRTGD